MFCPKCGARASETDTFCGACGTDLRRGEKPESLTTSEKVPPQFGGVPVAAVPNPEPAVIEKGKKGNRAIAIGIAIAAAVALVTVILICVFVFSVKPCYVITKSSYYNTSSPYVRNTEHNEQGATIKTYVAGNGDDSVHEYREFAEGLSIGTDETGNYDTDTNGYVSFIEVFGPSGALSYSTTYEYYSPGVIKSITKRNNDKSSTVDTYDEDGWHVSSVHTDSDGTVTELKYSYSFSNNDKSVKAVCKDSSKSSSSESVYMYDLDDNGNITKTYSGDRNTLTVAYTWEKIEHPAKMVAAISRLK